MSARRAGKMPVFDNSAFTILELLVVIAIIIALAGLVLATVGYVQKKGARSRAEAEIAAISAACESYKADNGIYPRDTTTQTTDNLNARVSGNPSNYESASLFLYKTISGDSDGDRVADQKSYFTFKPNMLTPTGGTGPVTAIRDPFGNSYGYSTANQKAPSEGYNPTFDLWSTAGLTTDPPNSGTDTITPQWIKNW
jgi:type II secretory pathway pseudopilin PulG